ncbi:GrpB family protein [Jeongeupia naejangsanensis]|uniref:GrpB family protein n=1 Tax=Jeongeupia naejangsanensis TaxID=613195 RepID=A0ABS2BF94_9NEIS|nr:GrpB family protein [Jeongeupia naejangsanensis]MBM3114283.1 GrpB family protein [Jeongeupia naejangsanensis]
MRKIEIVAYNKQWPSLFAEESALLQVTLGKVLSKIHHVGSTSVPGLAAKPVIDILLEVVDLDDLDNLNPAMTNIGYTARGEYGIPNRRYFSKGGDQRSHQIHAFAIGDEHIIKLLAFRNYLIKNEDVAEQYAEIKRAAILASENELRRYSAFKAGFIEDHLRLALMDQEQKK